MKRSNETNQGKASRDIGKGQTLVTPIGKDSSDYAGPVSKEVTSKMKLGGGIHDYSKVKGG
jgi:hypothetical protein